MQNANTQGASVAFRTRVVLNEIGRAIEEIDALQRGVTAVLRVGAPSVTAAVVELRERLPDAVVQLIEGRVQELIHCLLQGELDYVFGAVTPELITSDMFALLEPVVLLKDELCVLASTSNQGMVGRQLKWADLQAAQWVVPPRETLVRQAFMTAFLNAGMTPPVPVIEAMSSVTIGSVLRTDVSLPCAVRLEHAINEIAQGGVQHLQVTPRVVLPSFGLFFRRDTMARPIILTQFAEAIRSVTGDRRSRRRSTAT